MSGQGDKETSGQGDFRRQSMDCLKNVLTSERKWVILCIDMGLSMFFGGT